jgi:excinuclease UvrABC helicase subunit UvrB
LKKTASARFELNSEHQPSGDQPEAIKVLTNSIAAHSRQDLALQYPKV